MEWTDSQLLEACAKGDERAWGRLVDRYSRLVYSVPRRYRLTDADCDDVTQTVFGALLRKMGSIKDGAALPKWLVTSAQRETWKIAKARRRDAQLSDVDSDCAEAAAATAASIELRETAREALSELGGRCEALLRALLSSGPEVSYALIAQSLNMPVGSVGPTRARCLSKLLEILRRRAPGIGFEDVSGGVRTVS